MKITFYPLQVEANARNTSDALKQFICASCGLPGDHHEYSGPTHRVTVYGHPTCAMFQFSAADLAERSPALRESDSK